MTRRPNAQDRFRQFAAGITDPGTGLLATRRPNPARCRHPESSRLVRRMVNGGPAFDVSICGDCSTWLPLGPANDAPPEVQQEIRAAEIAAGRTARGHLLLCDLHEWDEAAGWATYPIDSSVTGAESGNAAWHAGYLARAIVEHDDS